METQKFKEGMKVRTHYKKGKSSWAFGGSMVPGLHLKIKHYQIRDNSYFLTDDYWYHEDELELDGHEVTSLTPAQSCATSTPTVGDASNVSTLSTNVTKTKINFNY
jgi:hypothetical protein